MPFCESIAQVLSRGCGNVRNLGDCLARLSSHNKYKNGFWRYSLIRSAARLPIGLLDGRRVALVSLS